MTCKFKLLIVACFCLGDVRLFLCSFYYFHLYTPYSQLVNDVKLLNPRVLDILTNDKTWKLNLSLCSAAATMEFKQSAGVSALFEVIQMIQHGNWIFFFDSTLQMICFRKISNSPPQGESKWQLHIHLYAHMSMFENIDRDLYSVVFCCVISAMWENWKICEDRAYQKTMRLQAFVGNQYEFL